MYSKTFSPTPRSEDYRATFSSSRMFVENVATQIMPHLSPPVHEFLESSTVLEKSEKAFGLKLNSHSNSLSFSKLIFFLCEYLQKNTIFGSFCEFHVAF
jgi:hypothetical protein